MSYGSREQIPIKGAKLGCLALWFPETLLQMLQSLYCCAHDLQQQQAEARAMPLHFQNDELNHSFSPLQSVQHLVSYDSNRKWTNTPTQNQMLWQYLQTVSIFANYLVKY